MCLHTRVRTIYRRLHVVTKLNCRNQAEGPLEVTRSRLLRESGNVSEKVQDRDFVVIDHR